MDVFQPKRFDGKVIGSNARSKENQLPHRPFILWNPFLTVKRRPKGIELSYYALQIIIDFELKLEYALAVRIFSKTLGILWEFGEFLEFLWDFVPADDSSIEILITSKKLVLVVLRVKKGMPELNLIFPLDARLYVIFQFFTSLPVFVKITIISLHVHEPIHCSCV